MTAPPPLLAQRCLPRRRLAARRRRRPPLQPPGAQVFVGPFAGDKNTPPPCTTASSLPFLLYEIQHQTLTIWLSVFVFDPITNVVYVVLCLLTSLFIYFLQKLWCTPMAFAGSAPGPRVSMEITDEMLKSMEVGLACRNYNGRISSMDFHRKDTKYLVTASDDEAIRLYDTQDAVCLNTINSKKYGTELVCFTDNPNVVLCSSNNGWDESLRLLSMNDNRFIRYYKGHVDRVVCITVCSGEEIFLSASLDRKVLLWDHRAEKSQGVMRVQRRPAVSYDGQGMVFAVAFGRHIRMYDTRKFGKEPFATFNVGTDDSEPHVIKFSSDGRRILLTTKGGRVHVLDSFEGNRIATCHVKPMLTNLTLDASFSPEGNHIISGSGDGSVCAWNVESGKVACWRSTTDTKPPRVRWSPGSLMFVTGTTELSCWVPDLSKVESFTITDTQAPADTDTE